MRRGGDTRFGGRRPGIAALFARLGLWLAALSLLSQSLALAAPPMVVDAHSAAAELTALLGPGVVVCAHPDDSQAPSPPHDCHDQCPLCQAVANAAALDAPTTGTRLAPPQALAEPIVVSPQTRGIAAPRPAVSLARGPPSQT